MSRLANTAAQRLSQNRMCVCLPGKQLTIFSEQLGKGEVMYICHSYRHTTPLLIVD